MDCLPYEGRAPLTAVQNMKGAKEAEEIPATGAGAVGAVEASCRRLARVIIDK
jgi:hypothetical protein